MPTQLRPSCVLALVQDPLLGKVPRFSSVLLVDGVFNQLSQWKFKTARDAYLHARQGAFYLKRKYDGVIEYDIDPLLPPGSEMTPLHDGDALPSLPVT